MTVADRVFPKAQTRAFPQERLAGSVLPLTLLLYSLLLPVEVRFTLAGLLIYPYRVALFALLPWMWRRLANGGMKFMAADYLVFLATAWMTISFVAFYGIGDGLVRGGALTFDALGAYLVGRLSLRSTWDLRRILILFAPGLLFAGMLVAVESITHRPFIHPLFSSVFGALPTYVGGEAVGASVERPYYRLGLLRASGPFSHPILAGVFLASMLPLYITSGIRGWPRYLGIVAGFCAIFSVSSAAFLGFLLGLGLIGLDLVQRRTTFITWPRVVWAVLALSLIAEVGSQNGLTSVLIRFTLDPSTGYFRTLIWHYGTLSVMKHPLFGIGFSAYERLPWMVPSIDAHFLNLGVRHGLIVPFALLGSAILTLWKLGQNAAVAPKGERFFMVGTAICLFTIVILGQTVSYFGSVGLWFYIVFAAGASLAQATQPADSQDSQRAVTARFSPSAN